jgi:thiamine-phosphate pyrophosphorylase
MKESFGLYVILTDPVAGYEKFAAAAVAAGVRYLQLRVKDRPDEEILEIARELRKITAGSPTRLIIKDSPRIAAESGADGVHLGQKDMPLPAARKILTRPGSVFGLSTHNAAQAQAAIVLGPDYIGVGPVFPTPTKTCPDPVLGVEEMGRIVRSSPLTVVAIGGINEANLPRILAAGAKNFAAVRPLMSSPDPRRALARLQAAWRELIDRHPNRQPAL